MNKTLLEQLEAALHADTTTDMEADIDDMLAKFKKWLDEPVKERTGKERDSVCKKTATP